MSTRTRLPASKPKAPPKERLDWRTRLVVRVQLLEENLENLRRCIIQLESQNARLDRRLRDAECKTMVCR